MNYEIVRSPINSSEFVNTVIALSENSSTHRSDIRIKIDAGGNQLTYFL